MMKEIRYYLNRMTTAGNVKDYKTYMEKNQLFHAYFHQTLGNIILPEHIENVRNRFTRLVGIIISLPGFGKNTSKRTTKFLTVF
jgi:hypothetical protein